MAPTKRVDETPFPEDDPNDQRTVKEMKQQVHDQQELERARGEVVKHVAPQMVTIQSKTGGGEVAVRDLRDMSYADLTEHFGFSNAQDEIETDQFGPILEDKSKLVNRPIMLVHWNFYDGDYGEFVSAWVMTPEGERFIVNDGSTGMYAQLRTLTDTKNIRSMLLVKRGLRASDYTYTDPRGQSHPARTYYLDIQPDSIR